MGFFDFFGGGHDETYYNSTSTPLFKETPSIVAQTVGAAIVQNRNIATDLVANLVNGIGFKANMLYNYADTGDYPYGLPQGSRGILPAHTYSDVKLVIADQLGVSIHLLNCAVGNDPLTDNYIYYAEYNLIDSTGQIISNNLEWSYDESTHVYPILDVVESFDIDKSPYYPIIPIRVNDSYTVNDQIRKAAKFLDLKADDIKAGIAGQGEGPANDAYIVIGIEIADNTQAGLEYLFEFFKQMQALDLVDKAEHEYWLALDGSNRGMPSMNTITVADANYRMNLGWLWSETRIVTGTIADVGKFTHSYSSNSGNAQAASVMVEGVLKTYTYSTSSIKFRKQISSTQYSEVEVSGLVHSNNVVGHTVRTTLQDAFSDGDDSKSFNIPVRRDILTRLGAVKTHDLLYKSIRLVVNDKVEVKLKWYQTGFFAFVLTIIAVVLTIVYPPLGVAAFSALAVGIALIEVIAFKLLLPVIVKKLEDLIGEELTLLIEVIAIIYGGGGSAGSYISAGMKVASSINATRFEDALADIASELDKVRRDVEDLLEEEAETQIDVMQALANEQADTYNIMQANDYVKKSFYTIQEHMLIKEFTHYFTDVAKQTDRPKSYINIGYTL